MRFVVGALVQFLPLSLFAGYAFWEGLPPPADRWPTAFMLGAAAAVVQLAVLLRRRAPVNRLILGADLYLVVGGLTALARQWWLLRVYGTLAEAGIFTSMLLVGVVTTMWSPAGYVGAAEGDQHTIRLYSLWLLGATVLAIVWSLLFRGGGRAAVVLPILVLIVSNRYLAHRLRRAAPPA